MQKYKYLIIGGGVAGTTAAETIRANDQNSSLAIITDESYPLYSRVMLSKPSFLLEEAPAAGVWLKNPEWYKENGIEYLSGKSVVALDVAAKTVTFGNETVNYEKLLLAVGTRSRRWNVKGSDKQEIYYLRTLDEAQKLATAMKIKKCAVVIGSSCIAFEAIENLRSARIAVCEVMLEKYFWEPMLDEEGGRIVERALLGNGVKIYRQSEVLEVTGGENVEGILTKSGEKIPCDLILCGIGVVYPVGWIKTAGLKINRGIAVNEYLETSAPGVWAAGDVAEFKDIVLNELYLAGNWMSAREQGRIAGLNMTGRREPFQLVSFYTSHAFGVNVAFAGDIRLLPSRTSLGRGSADSGSHARLILQKGKIMGTAMVKLIESKLDVSQELNELADPDFDLKLLLPN